MRPRRTRWFSGVVCSVVVVVVVVRGAATVGGDEQKAEIFRDVHEVEVAGAPVRAAELWSVTLEALECYRRAGLRTLGPYPSVDGSGVEAAIEAHEDDSIDLRCSDVLVPAQIRFSDDHDPQEARALVSVRSSIEACLRDAGVEVASTPAVPAGGGAADDTVNLDESLHAAAMSHPDVFGSCASSAHP